jgi:hypothetical protein
VAEFYYKKLPKPRPRGARAQLPLVQAAVDRGWAYHDRLSAQPAEGHLSKGAAEVFRFYCQWVLHRPAVCVGTGLVPVGEADVWIAEMAGVRFELRAFGNNEVIGSRTSSR